MKYAETACGVKLRTAAKVIATLGMVMCVVGFGLSVSSSMSLCQVEVKENVTKSQGTSDEVELEATTQDVVLTTEPTEMVTESLLETVLANATVEDPVAIPSNITEDDGDDTKEDELEVKDGREKRAKMGPRSAGPEEPIQGGPRISAEKVVNGTDDGDSESQDETITTSVTHLSSTSTTTATTTTSTVSSSSSTTVASTESSTTDAPEVPSTTSSTTSSTTLSTSTATTSSTVAVPTSPSTTEAAPTHVTSSPTTITTEASTQVTTTTTGPDDVEDKCDKMTGWVIAVVGIVVSLAGFAANVNLLHSARKSKPSLAMVWLVWAAALYCLQVALIVDSGLESDPGYIVLHVILLMITGLSGYIVLSFRKKLLSGHNLTFGQEMKMNKLKDDAYHELKMEDGGSFGSRDDDTKV